MADDAINSPVRAITLVTPGQPAVTSPARSIPLPSVATLQVVGSIAVLLGAAVITRRRWMNRWHLKARKGGLSQTRRIKIDPTLASIGRTLGLGRSELELAQKLAKMHGTSEPASLLLCPSALRVAALASGAWASDVEAKPLARLCTALGIAPENAERMLMNPPKPARTPKLAGVTKQQATALNAALMKARAKQVEGPGRPA